MIHNINITKGLFTVFVKQSFFRIIAAALKFADGYLVSILVSGFCISGLKNLTVTPTKTAEMIVPSLVPKSFPSKKISERTTDISTQVISKMTLTVPNSFFVTSEIAFTIASP